MAPPGADTLTSSAPSAVGPRDDHVYCRSAAILERSEYCGCPICDETKAPTAIEQPEVPDEGRNQTQSDAIKMQSRSMGRYLMRGAISNQWWRLEVLGATQRQSEANKTPTKCNQNTIKLRSRRNQGAIKAQSRRRQDAITMQSRTRRATRRERGSIVSRRGDKDHAVLIHSTLAHLRETAGVVQVGILAKRKVDDVYACPRARTGEESRRKACDKG
jgi:hypothetical protein